MLILLNCHFNQLVQELRMMRGPHGYLEQVNCNKIQANLTQGQFLKIGFYGKFGFMNPWKVWKAELEMVCSISIQIHNQTVCRDDTQIRKQMLVPDLYVIHSNFQPIIKRQKHDKKIYFSLFSTMFSNFLFPQKIEKTTLKS